MIAWWLQTSNETHIGYISLDVQLPKKILKIPPRFSSKDSFRFSGEMGSYKKR